MPPEWILILGSLGGFAALLTAAGAVYAHMSKRKNDLVDQLQEERDRTGLDRERLEQKYTALSLRVETIVTVLNAALATNALKDLHIVILTNHVHAQNLRIEKHDPPADPLPILPELPTYSPYV